jgi:phage terminase Nu1 subunit (DNA packaging protein)
MALGEVVNRAHLAAVFGVARTTVDAWVAAGCPVVKRPAKRGDAYQFAAPAVHAWPVERAVHAAAGGEAGAGDTAALTAERARLARLQGDAQEMKNAEQRGELLPRDEVTAAVVAAFTRVRARLLALPTRAAPLVASKRSLPEIKALLTELVYEALRELSETRVVAIASGDEVP